MMNVNTAILNKDINYCSNGVQQILYTLTSLNSNSSRWKGIPMLVKVITPKSIPEGKVFDVMRVLDESKAKISDTEVPLSRVMDAFFSGDGKSTNIREPLDCED